MAFTPAPTYADPVIVDETTGKARFNPIWLRWFLDVAQSLTQSAVGTGTGAVVHQVSPTITTPTLTAPVLGAATGTSLIVTGDLAVTTTTNGLVLKDAAGTPHYWRVTVNAAGALVTTDLGTSYP